MLGNTKQRWRRGVSRFFKEWVGLFAFAAVVLVSRSSLADHYQVPSESMQPTVQVGDHVLVDKRAYGLRVPFTTLHVTEALPQRGDVIVLESPEDGRVLLKRVVALPGDRVQVKEGELWLDDKSMEVSRSSDSAVEVLSGHPHTLDLSFGGGPDFGPELVPSGKLLVMGDNRGNSHDGRAFGYVERDAVLGRVAGVFVRHGALDWLDLN